MLLPDGGLLAIPPGVEDPVAYARNSGAAVLRRGNEVVWRRAQDRESRPDPDRAAGESDRVPSMKPPVKRRHLAVVR